MTDSAGATYAESLDSGGGVRWKKAATDIPDIQPSGWSAVVGSNDVVYFAENIGLSHAPILGFDASTGALVFDHSYDRAYKLYSYAGGLILISDHDRSTSTSRAILFTSIRPKAFNSGVARSRKVPTVASSWLARRAQIQTTQASRILLRRSRQMESPGSVQRQTCMVVAQR